ncbi:MAG: hypothetical protein WD847_08200 [Pirellulales bacterium]
MRRLHSEEGLEVKIATRRSEFARVWKLMYRAYRERGYIPANASGMVYRLSYGLPTSHTVLALDELYRLVGTMTIVGDNRLGLPMETVFHSRVQRLRDDRRRIAEVSGLAVDPAFARRSPAIFHALSRFMMQYACWHEYDDLLIAVHPRHEDFYRRWFRFQPFATCPSYSAVSGNPAVACRLDLQSLLEAWCRQMIESYFGRVIPVERLESPPMRAADHEYFCRLVGKLPTPGAAVCPAERRRAG